MQFIGILKHGWNRNEKLEIRLQEFCIDFSERIVLGDSENENNIDFVARNGVRRSREESSRIVECN